ncbi:hypothetical protein E4U39_004538 [Claviceps sp. Clav50 group G5]|nr:hypothetical protein E4U39_004538 [Claviceps sp. Clav50 group G5]
MKPFQQGTNSSLVCHLLIAQFIAPSTMNYLNMMGFGSLGPIAGSLAANVQSGIGNVVAGSLFARLQSAGMGGQGMGGQGAADSRGAQAAMLAVCLCHMTGTCDENQDGNREEV